MFLNLDKKRPSIRSRSPSTKSARSAYGGGPGGPKSPAASPVPSGKIGFLDDITTASVASRSTSPYSFYYPTTVLESMTVLSTAADPAKSPGFQERVEARQRKKEYFVSQSVVFEQFKSSNLSTVHKAFVQNVADDGTLTRTQFTTSLLSIGVSDRGIIDRCFDLFDSHKEGIIDYREVIAAVEVIVNGTNKQITMKDCFQLFDPSNCGYIIQPRLQEIKRNRLETDGINHMMVKALLEIFDELQREEEERRKKEASKKGKKGKKGAPLTDPMKYSKKIHLSYDEFCTFLSSRPLLVQAFMTQVLLTMENVYNRNRKVLAKRDDLSSTLSATATPA